MKRTLLILSLFTGIGFANSQIVNIPDANFKAYLLASPFINTNSDTEIQVAEATAFNSQLNCQSLNISDLTGIEAFTSMTGLQCESNLLTSLDVSACSSLLYLYCQDNQLTSLDFSPAVKELSCSNNQLISIDASANADLYILFCNNNQLTSLNVANGNNDIMWTSGFNTTGNSGLTCIQVDDSYYSLVNWWYIDSWTSYSNDCNGSFGCTVTIPDANFKAYLVGNASINTNSDSEIQCSEAVAFTGQIWLQALNISDLTGIEAFTALTSLNCNSNLLTSLDISANSALVVLNFAGNQISTIDVSNNLQLSGLYCDYNQLTTIDVNANVNLTELSINNNNLSQLDISANSNLIELGCESNSLTNLNVANGNNINFTAFYATNNPNLTCIQVDDITYSTANWNNIDAGASFSLNCGSSAALNENELNNINFYPNPATNYITIKTNNNLTSIEIFDLTGALVQTENTNSFSIENLNGGVYMMNINTNNGTVIKRLIKK